MNWIASAELAAAVSQAGGLGLISPDAGMALSGDPVENLRQQIRKAKSLTDKPFGVNLPLERPQIKDLIDAAIEEGISVIVTSVGNPAAYTEYIRQSGVKVLHVVASVRHARRAEAEGVDAIIAEGYEAGGHLGFDELPTMVLVPQVVDAVSKPVVAAGGIADARGFVAALALGAEGVQMGTRFIATHECIAHPNFKQALLQVSDTGTIVTARKLGPARVLKSELTTKLLEMEGKGASTEELLSFIGSGRARAGQLAGDFKEGEAYCGAIAGMIKDIISAEEVIGNIVENVPTVLSRLQ